MTLFDTDADTRAEEVAYMAEFFREYVEWTCRDGATEVVLTLPGNEVGDAIMRAAILELNDPRVRINEEDQDANRDVD